MALTEEQLKKLQEGTADTGIDLIKQGQQIVECRADCVSNNIQDPTAAQQCSQACEANNGAQGIQVYVYLLLCLT